MRLQRKLSMGSWVDCDDSEFEAYAFVTAEDPGRITVLASRHHARLEFWTGGRPPMEYWVAAGLYKDLKVLADDRQPGVRVLLDGYFFIAELYRSDGEFIDRDLCFANHEPGWNLHLIRQQKGAKPKRIMGRWTNCRVPIGRSGAGNWWFESPATAPQLLSMLTAEDRRIIAADYPEAGREIDRLFEHPAGY